MHKTWYKQAIKPFTCLFVAGLDWAGLSSSLVVKGGLKLLLLMLPDALLGVLWTFRPLFFKIACLDLLIFTALFSTLDSTRCPKASPSMISTSLSRQLFLYIYISKTSGCKQTVLVMKNVWSSVGSRGAQKVTVKEIFSVQCFDPSLREHY